MRNCLVQDEILHYNTDFSLDSMDEDDLDYPGMPHGYDKFKNAVIRAYGAQGRKMLRYTKSN